MNIGTVADRSGVPAKSIRYYERIGLIRSAKRQANGYRAYTDVEMHTLRFINRARDLGFSVDEVRELLSLWRDTGRSSVAVKAVATRHLEALERKVAAAKSIRLSLASLIERRSGNDRPDCPILEDQRWPNLRTKRKRAPRRGRRSTLRSET